MVRKISHAAPLFFSLFAGLFFLLHNYSIKKYAYEGILLWGKLLVPVLLPYIILSKLWLSYGMIDDVQKFFCKIIRQNMTLANLLPILLIGLICGYPTGAIFVEAYYKENTLSKSQAEFLLPLCSFVSPMFLAGYVHPLLNLPATKWILVLFSLYLSPILLFVYHFIMKKDLSAAPCVLFSIRDSDRSSSRESFTEILDSSLHIIFTIGLYIMIFSILSGFAREHCMNRLSFVFLLSNLEVTSGVSVLTGLTFLPPLLKSLLVTFVLAFGGICCLGQIRSILSSSDLEMKPYLLIKIKQAGISALILACLWNLF